jgi:hypothetical protein
MEKFKQGVFGKCPRVICESQHLLPMGQHDVPNVSNVKLYCARCEDIYNPKSSRHNSIDGAYIGTSFHNILFQVYPALAPTKTQRRYEPRIYGFRVHASASLMRWQEERREEMKERLKALRTRMRLRRMLRVKRSRRVVLGRTALMTCSRCRCRLLRRRNEGDGFNEVVLNGNGHYGLSGWPTV